MNRGLNRAQGICSQALAPVSSARSVRPFAPQFFTDFCAQLVHSVPPNLQPVGAHWPGSAARPTLRPMPSLPRDAPHNFERSAMTTRLRTAPRLLPRTTAAALALTLGWAVMAAPAWASGDEAKPAKSFTAGMDIREQADLKDIGLPAYPGARPQRDKKDDKEGATVGFSFGPFGMKLVVSKFASNDELEQVSQFYRDALGAYGKVMDCSHGSPEAQAAQARKARGEKKDPNGCGDSGGDRDERVYKVGTEKNFRLVSLKPVGREVHFQLLRMELRGL